MARRLAAFLCCASSAVVGAMFVQVDVRNVPVDRIVANLESELAAKPKDTAVLVNLARVHAMAFAQKSDTVPAAAPMGLKPEYRGPWLGQGAPEHMQPPVRPTKDPKAEAAARIHLDRAIARYREALAIDSQHLVAKIGLGWALVQAGDRPGAIQALRDVVARAWPKDQKGGLSPGSGVVFFGYRYLTEEAARYLLPLLDPVKDRQEIEDLKAKATSLEQMPRAITPIAVPLEDGLAAVDIEAPDRGVMFDADGSGLPKRWTWIHPNAAWLVFDRYREGRITSALQLFGSVTFWLFWDNGYDALRALDDNGDGSISGRELEGLSLWHDRNANGVSERGEVRQVAAWGIVALSCRFQHDERHPDEIAFSRNGVTFANGTVRPTFDLLLRTARK